MRLLSNTLSVIRHLNCYQISILEDTNQTSVRVRASVIVQKMLILHECKLLRLDFAACVPLLVFP